MRKVRFPVSRWGWFLPIRRRLARTSRGAPDLKRDVDALFQAHGGIRGRNFQVFVEAMKARGITVFQDKFSERYLKTLRFEAKTIVDVGVNFGTPELYRAFSDRRILLVEPFPALLDRCRDEFPMIDFVIYEVAAGSADGTADLIIMDEHGHNSIKTRVDVKGRCLNTIPVKVRRIDSLLSSGSHPGPYGIKIDTEGHELEALRGCKGVMGEVEFVLAELSIKNIYLEGYSFSDVVALMAEYGFEVFDILNPSGRPPTFFDVLFLRRGDPRMKLGWR